MTRYVLVSMGRDGSFGALTATGYFRGEPVTFASVREAVDYHDNSYAPQGSLSVMTIEKYERRKIEWLISQA